MVRRNRGTGRPAESGEQSRGGAGTSGREPVRMGTPTGSARRRSPEDAEGSAGRAGVHCRDTTAGRREAHGRMGGRSAAGDRRPGGGERRARLGAGLAVRLTSGTGGRGDRATDLCPRHAVRTRPRGRASGRRRAEERSRTPGRGTEAQGSTGRPVLAARPAAGRRAPRPRSRSYTGGVAAGYEARRPHDGARHGGADGNRPERLTDGEMPRSRGLGRRGPTGAEERAGGDPPCQGGRPPGP